MGCKNSKVSPAVSEKRQLDKNENGNYPLSDGHRPKLVTNKEEGLQMKRKAQNEQSILTQLRQEGILADTGSGGVSFYVALDGEGKDTSQPTRKPPRILQKLERRAESRAGQFSREDKAIMAEIIHQEKITATVENARKSSQRQLEVSNRRAEKERQARESIDRKLKKAEDARKRKLGAIEEWCRMASGKHASASHKREMQEFKLIEKLRQKEINVEKRKRALEVENTAKLASERRLGVRERREHMLRRVTEEYEDNEPVGESVGHTV